MLKIILLRKEENNNNDSQAHFVNNFTNEKTIILLFPIL